MKTRLH